MSKSILVIDTPSTCADCPLSQWAGIEPVNKMTYLRCYAMHRVMCLVDEGKVLVDICPLKPMPHKRGGDEWADGWNACIDELEGKDD